MSGDDVDQAGHLLAGLEEEDDLRGPGFVGVGKVPSISLGIALIYTVSNHAA